MINRIKIVVVDAPAERANPQLFRDPRLIWSSPTEVSPVLIGDEYQIFYRPDVFCSINMVDLIRSIDGIFGERFPGVTFQLGCQVVSQDHKIRFVITDRYYAQGLLQVGTLRNIIFAEDQPIERLGPRSTPRNVPPVRSKPSWDSLLESPSRNRKSDERFWDDGDNDDDDDDEWDDDDEFDDDEDDERKSFHRSRVLSNADHPKRDIKRHNIIIAEKKDVERDKKVIESFLKDFMPGKEEWVKEYRSEIAKRWIRAMAVKEKEAKRREKEFKAAKKKSTAKRHVKTINTIASRVFDSRGRSSAFYDPNK